VVLAAQALEERLLIRFLTAMVSVLLFLWVRLSALIGQTPREVTRNRLGRATVEVPNVPIIWVHTASLGELTAIRPVLAYLSARHSAHHLVVTVNNERALPVLATWDDVRAFGQVAPIDVPQVVARFMAAWSPVAFINVEAELWPNRFAALAAAGTPSIFLNGRLSDKSLAMVQRLGADALHLGHFSYFFAQSSATVTNLQTLGVPPAKIEITRNLKAMVDLPSVRADLAGVFRRDRTLLAASTHPPEEAEVLRAYCTLRKQRPDVRLILSPRHPRRLQEVAALVRRVALDPVPLSDVSGTPAGNQVVIIDELGVQPGLYGLAAVTFVGGSLPPDIGGHTPYEPIRGGSAILAGPHTANFMAEYRILAAAGAYVRVDTAADLARAMAEAFDHAGELVRQAGQALPPPGDLHDTFARISEKLGLA